MRWNDQEAAHLANQTPEWEGKLTYRPPQKSRGPFAASSSEPRERWFRLRANCLFYFRLSPNNARPPFGAQPLGLLLLERFHVQKETFEDNVNAFSIIFSDEPGKKHMFVAESERNARQWESALKKASYQKMREQLINLQIKLTKQTGIDPLQGTVFANNPVFTRRNHFEVSYSPFSDTFVAPKPKPRKNRPTPTSSFQSHVVENWESYSPVKEQTMEYNNNPVTDDISRKASFKSHVEVPVGNLLDL